MWNCEMMFAKFQLQYLPLIDFHTRKQQLLKTSYKPHHLFVTIIPNAFNYVLSSGEIEM
jgi:hypothetical protein